MAGKMITGHETRLTIVKIIMANVIGSYNYIDRHIRALYKKKGV